jgi:15-cis-phytoene desaturase
MKHSSSDVIIIGGGLAGFSAAITLIEKGCSVQLIEARSILGGRTSSWNEQGMEVESGLHRFLGFYEALPKLLKHVGVDHNDILVWEDEIEIKMPDNEPSAVFGLSPLHKPLKTIRAILLNNDFLSPVEKAKVATFFTQGFIELQSDPQNLDKQSVYDYAKEHGISDELITRVLVPLTEGLFFLSVRKYSARCLFSLFAPYLTKLQKTRVGAFKGGMTDVMIKPLAEYFVKKGGQITVGQPVTKLVVENSRVQGVMCDENQFAATHVLLAASLRNAQQLIHDAFPRHSWFQDMLSLSSMPSVTFQLELTEPAMAIDRTTFSPTTIYSSYAEQSRTTFRHAKGRLSVILAEPEIYLKKSEEEILKVIFDDATRLHLHLTKKQVKQWRKISWPHDFYAYTKGNLDKIPPQKTPIPGLSLAGDYTKQEYLQTMEGAVVSGRLAAEAVLSNKN